jgi:transposase InsO family protein
MLSDNGPGYIAGELAEYIEANKMSHVRGAPMHPQTKGRIERQKSCGAPDHEEPHLPGKLLPAR